ISSGVPPPPTPVPASVPVHEVDLSDEWASLLEQSAAKDAPAEIAKVQQAQPAAETPHGEAISLIEVAPISAAPAAFELSEFQIPGESRDAEKSAAELPAPIGQEQSSSDVAGTSTPASEESIELI